VSCANNLKQIGLALHNYADIHAYKPATGQGSPRLPAGTIPNAGLAPDQRLSWLVAILPFIEEDRLYRQLDLRAGWESSGNLHLSQTRIRVFECGDWRREFSSAQPWETPYVGIAGLGTDAATRPLGAPNIGAFGYDRQVAFADVKDGTSNTVMVLESARDAGSWAQGGFTTVRGLDLDGQPYLGAGRPFGGTHFSENDLFKRGHSIGCNALMVDGSVRFLSDTTSPEVLEALATVAGGEKVPEDF
jgi:prepilin-type processing-associated H-X9-DG protein